MTESAKSSPTPPGGRLWPETWPACLLFSPMVRLYVGGIDAEVTPELLSGRFASFGTVAECEIIRRKRNDVSQPRLAPQLSSARRPSPGMAAAAEAAARETGCRGFAYVELEPKDDAALHRCLSTVTPTACIAAHMTVGSCNGACTGIQHMRAHRGPSRSPDVALTYDERYVSDGGWCNHCQSLEAFSDARSLDHQVDSTL